jgi:hypothetical protein
MSIQLRSILPEYTSNTYYLPINLSGSNNFVNFYSSNLIFLPANNTLLSYNVRATGTGFIFPDGTVQTTASSGGASEPSLGVSGTYGNTSYVPVVTVAANGRVTSVVNTAISGVSEPALGVSGTYGNTTFVPVVTVSSNGRVTSVVNTAISFPAEPSLGISGTYGNTSYVPVITVAANGRITNVVNTAITASGGGVSASGYLANSIIFANTTGYLSNTSGLQFISSNNTLLSYNVRATGTGFIFPDGTVQTTAGGGTGLSSGIVTVGTYGNTSYVPVITVDTYGRVTNVVNTAISGASEPALGVSGTYGNTTFVPVVTVAANGRITNVVNTAISTTLAQAAFDKANTDVTNITTTAGTYGNTSYVPVVTVAANGRITAVTNTAISANAEIIYVIDGSGLVLSTGFKGALEVPFNCTINGFTMLADQSGNVAIQINKDTYTNALTTFTPLLNTGANTINLVNQIKNTSTTLTNWNTTINTSDILTYNVSSILSPTNITRLSVCLKVTKS